MWIQGKNCSCQRFGYTSASKGYNYGPVGCTHPDDMISPTWTSVIFGGCRLPKLPKRDNRSLGISFTNPCSPDLQEKQGRSHECVTCDNMWQVWLKIEHHQTVLNSAPDIMGKLLFRINITVTKAKTTFERHVVAKHLSIKLRTANGKQTLNKSSISTYQVTRSLMFRSFKIFKYIWIYTQKGWADDPYGFNKKSLPAPVGFSVALVVAALARSPGAIHRNSIGWLT